MNIDWTTQARFQTKTMKSFSQWRILLINLLQYLRVSLTLETKQNMKIISVLINNKFMQYILKFERNSNIILKHG